MHRHLTAALLITGGSAWAGGAVAYLKDAAELVDDEGGSCSRKVGPKLDDAIDAMKELQDEGGHKARKEARRALDKVTDAVEDHCKGKVAAKISKLVAKASRKLDDVDGDDDDDERRSRRRRDDRDDDREPAPAPTPRQNGVTLNSGGFTLSMGGSTSTTSTTVSSTGRYPMSGSAYQSFLVALEANRNEILKKDAAVSTLQRNYVSARQLGGVLDQFTNEILKMDVAKAARVIDPANAVGLSSKFRNSIYQSEFVAVMNQQQ